jgi:hypothetical protein
MDSQRVVNAYMYLHQAHNGDCIYEFPDVLFSMTLCKQTKIDVVPKLE